MKKVLGRIGKIFGVIFFITAFLTWISYEYPDFSPFFSNIFFPSFFEQIGVVVNWGLVVMQAVIGAYLWKLEEYLN